MLYTCNWRQGNLRQTLRNFVTVFRPSRIRPEPADPVPLHALVRPSAGKPRVSLAVLARAISELSEETPNQQPKTRRISKTRPFEVKISRDIILSMARLQASAIGRSPTPRTPCRNSPVWEFPKIRSTLFWGPFNKDPTI